MEWKLADAKNRFSELVTMVLQDGVQRVRRRDQVVVMISEPEYERLTGVRSRFRDFLLSAPDLSGINLARDPSPMRDVSL